MAPLSTSQKIAQTTTAFVAGLVFTIGLALGTMTQPAAIRGFLDVTGHWSPTLLLVMGSAIAVYSPIYWLWAHRRPAPFFTHVFLVPPKRKVDMRLVLGAALFGVGWALAGWCPGPAISAVGAASKPALLFVLAMVGGSYATKIVVERKG